MHTHTHTHTHTHMHALYTYNTRIHACMDAWTHGYGYMDTSMHGYMDTLAHATQIIG
jgi:hypothetical protein